MKATLVLLLLSTGVVADESELLNGGGNPLAKVLTLLNTLEAKIIKDGYADQKAYKTFFEWCDLQSSNLGKELKDAAMSKSKASAQITELTSDIDTSATKIDLLVKRISEAETAVKGATAVRTDAAAIYVTAEAALVSGIDTLGRAHNGLKKGKTSASLAQIDEQSMMDVIQSLAVVVDAAGFEAKDMNKLTAMLQANSDEEDGDDALAAPAKAVYQKGRSSGILDMLEEMKDKAEKQLNAMRKAEAKDIHDYQMLKQSLTDQLKEDNEDLVSEKTAKSVAEQTKATTTGDLNTAVKQLKENNKALETTRKSCMTTASDHETSMTARAEELKVLRQAMKILAPPKKLLQTGQEGSSFLQLAVSSKMDSEFADSEIIVTLRQLAKEHHSMALNQLASRVTAAMRYGHNHGADPFVKVRGLIADMIAKLEKTAAAEAGEKAYCDGELAKTNKQKATLTDEINNLDLKIKTASGRSTKYKANVATWQSELADLSKSTAAIIAMRLSENKIYKSSKADTEEGLAAVRKAVQLLREYYGSNDALVQVATDEDDSNYSFMEQPAAPEAHAKSGAGSTIISILELVESDYAKELSKLETQESDAVSAFEKATQQNAMTKVGKENDVKGQSRAAVTLDKQLSEWTGDRDNVGVENAAVDDYLAKLKERCIKKGPTPEELIARREAEIKGLETALDSLASAGSFIQLQSRTRHNHFLSP